MELMASVLKPAAALPSSKNLDSTGRRADGCAELNSESDDAGAADDGRGCPEEIAAI